MTEIKSKLYRLVRDVKLPSYASYDYFKKSYVQHSEKRPAWFALFWPSGYPNLAAEMYLMERAASLRLRRLDGGSAKVVASRLSMLLRYCWTIRRHVSVITDDDMRLFIHWLMTETKSRNKSALKRKRRTINKILTTWIEFLIWLQENIYLDRVIVGTRGQGPQVTCKEKSYLDYRGRQKIKIEYVYAPTDDAPDPKKPIARDLRNRLWDSVKALSHIDRYSPRYKARFSSIAEFTNTILYLKKRRELMLMLLEALGCRPGELVRLRVTENLDCAKSGRLVIVTLKSGGDNCRRVPLEGSVCIKLELFISKHRDGLLQGLRSAGKKLSWADEVFLCIDGAPMTEYSLTKDFQRIVQEAEVTQRACMSMFRHRFITLMIALHLREFMLSVPGKTRALMTDADYLSILKRVAAFTGHKDPNSLMHYLDLAWEEIGAFDYVQPAYELIGAVENAMRTITELAEGMKDEKVSKSAKDEAVSRELSEILNRVSASLQATKRGKKVGFPDSLEGQ